ncbi:hypothetical protein K431DRAFT_293627 [Polychaeton citri CBS 116435]|uniref:Zn(2)-C6 fungal-type domain-containing protein n=1 Tax=Polychaeton citri CBS 116435 TaxID=1314669 RepID=A0A9P4Q7V4_9PEZI|nr:hypothetical protein K431DRAFT_293627 [Polychaeton citri CBS 116435]
MPKRSSGCDECRRRKVRCDGDKPECQRCLRYGVRCPGYRQPVVIGEHFVIHTANTAILRHGVPSPTSPKLGEVHPPGHGILVLRSGEEDTIRSWHAQLRHAGEDFDAQELEIIVPPSPTRISLQHLYRLQMLSAFLDVRFPSPSDKAVSKSSYVAALPGMDLSLPLVQAAIDSLCFAGLGSAYGDSSSLQEAQRRYGAALKLLGEEVSRPPTRTERRRPVVTSMMLLCLCEQFDTMTLGANTASGWIAHLNGAQQYLKACGPCAISSPFDWLLFHNLRLSALFLGIVQRKAVVFAEPQWLDLTEGRKPDGSIALHDLSNLAMAVPSLLERSDKLMETPLRDTFWKLALTRLCKEIAALRSQFDDWHALVHANELGYTLVSVAAFHEGFPRSNTPFPTVFYWHSIKTVRQYTMYWIFGLVLNCTALRLMHFLPQNSIRWPWDLDAIKADAYNQATNLCRTVPFCATNPIADIRELSRWYLDFAQNYFTEAVLHREELAWCKDARIVLEARVDSLLLPQKLWNLGRIAPYASVLTRYKTPHFHEATNTMPAYPVYHSAMNTCWKADSLNVDWALNAHNSATFVEELKRDPP